MERDDGDVPLSHYVDDHRGVDVLLNCNACMDHRVLPMAGVMKRLEALGRDPRKVGIREIALLMTAPCRRCGAIRWETRPAWPSRPGPPIRIGQ